MQSLETLSSEKNISFLDLDDEAYASKISFFLSQEFLQLTDSYQILLTSYDGMVSKCIPNYFFSCIEQR